MRTDKGTVCALACCLALAAATPGACLDARQFRQLVVLGDVHVANMMVSEAEWLADERGLVLGGWEQWPTEALIVVAPEGGEPVRIETAATPRLALSPDRQQIAYWAATGATWTQLAVVPIAGGRPRYVGEPRRIGPGMHLAWPTEQTICALLQDRDRCLALAITTATGAGRTLVEVTGGHWVRLRKWPGWDPIAVWAGDETKCFRLSPLGRTDEISPDFDFERAGPTAQFYSYFDERGALWLGGFRDRAPVKLADDAGAAAWAPDGSILLYAKRRELWSVWPEELEQRQVTGSALDTAGLEAAAPAGMTWSGDGGALAYWRHAGNSGQARKAQMGLEEVVIRARFDRGVKAALDQPLWVARELQFDDQGRVVEPVWATLKGKFAVRKILPGPEETILEAVSVGAQAGVLTRIAGRATPEPGPVPGPIPMQFTLKPIPDMVVWLHGTRDAGGLVGVEVRRVPLGTR